MQCVRHIICFSGGNSNVIDVVKFIKIAFTSATFLKIEMENISDLGKRKKLSEQKVERYKNRPTKKKVWIRIL